jgi:hypothetical protein
MARRNILMLTNSEYGQANIFMATAHSLLEKDPDVAIHIASYAELKPAVEGAAAFTRSTNKSATEQSIRFRSLPGMPMFTALEQEKDPAKNWFHATSLSPGFWNTPGVIIQYLRYLLLCWPADDFTMTFQAICDLIQELRPDVVAVDNLFAPGLTAAIHMSHRETPESAPGGRQYPLTVLNPNSFRDWTSHVEPRGAILWKYPVGSSALPIPLPLWAIPLNLWYFLAQIVALVGDKHTPARIKEIQTLTGLGDDLKVTSSKELSMSNLAGVDKVLVSCRKEIDFPEIDLEKIPAEFKEKVVGCGPIVRPAPSVSAVDPKLAAWLSKGQVVYVNLGTHAKPTHREAIQMASAFRHLLSARGGDRPQLRILWKLKLDMTRDWPPEASKDPLSGVREVLGAEMNADTVRIVEWLEPEPMAIMETGHVIANVNHGGANSFYEAVV